MNHYLWRPVLAAGLLMTSAAAGAVEIQRWEDDSGADVLFVEARELPIVDIQLTFDAGAARDGDQPGLARLTSNLLLEGTGELNAGEVARRFEAEGARIGTDSARDMGIVSLRSLSREENLNTVVDDLATILAEPAFPEAALQRVRSQMLVGLRRDQAQPASLGGRAFMEALYRDHPYSIPPDGTPESLQALNRADVTAFHQRYYVASNLTIAIVGDMDRERAEEIAARLARALPVGEPAPKLPPVPPRESAETIRIPFDSGQVHIYVGQPAVARGDDAYYPLYLGNHILGGSGLVSVLAQELREERGLSYSSYSLLAPAAREGRFQMGTQVRADAAGVALTVLRGSLSELRDEGPTPDQMEDAQRNITGGFPLALDSNGDLVGYIAMMGFYDLGLEYLDRFPERIEALSAGDVGTALRRQLDPDTMVTVLVGPEADIEAIGVE